MSMSFEVTVNGLNLPTNQQATLLKSWAENINDEVDKVIEKRLIKDREDWKQSSVRQMLDDIDVEVNGNNCIIRIPIKFSKMALMNYINRLAADYFTIDQYSPRVYGDVSPTFPYKWLKNNVYKYINKYGQRRS